MMMSNQCATSVSVPAQTPAHGIDTHKYHSSQEDSYVQLDHAHALHRLLQSIVPDSKNLCLEVGLEPLQPWVQTTDAAALRLDAQPVVLHARQLTGACPENGGQIVGVPDHWDCLPGLVAAAGNEQVMMRGM
ncbi:MAG: hypothetical protein FRX49_06376 [Trebouxia sp. A1-2]|nr:MAG: hypothetical protein FRX49_06376 [Trebouxia sp. A1-2]